MKACITNIQRFCMHDGPGIRTVVFFKGCPLHCKWCHNPEAQSLGSASVSAKAPGFCEKKQDRKIKTGAWTESAIELDEILLEVKKDTAFYGTTGGITLSGGEPMAQPKAALSLLKAAKKAGISTAVETCGYFDESLIPELCRYSDTLLWDFKDSDDTRHMANTGVSNQKILHNLALADQCGASIVLRCILLKGINYTERHLGKIRELKDSLSSCTKVEFLPYHPLGESKIRSLGIQQSFHNRKYMISPEELAYAYAVLNGTIQGIG